MKPTFFATPPEFRRWLERHHDSATELWVGLHKKGAGTPSITWPQAVDEALCFGWIDGIRKTVDGDSYMIRFTPRKPDSIWSAVNTKRARELIELGVMRPAGLEAFARRDEAKTARYSYERAEASLGDEYEEEMKKDGRAWEFFQSQPPSYRRLAAFYVVSAKREETRRRRLERLIRDSAAGVRIGILGKATDDR
jgi:uncharacterized protein YdeI (YjbR/CyaY-like superfamily)